MIRHDDYDRETFLSAARIVITWAKAATMPHAHVAAILGVDQQTVMVWSAAGAVPANTKVFKRCYARMLAFSDAIARLSQDEKVGPVTPPLPRGNTAMLAELAMATGYLLNPLNFQDEEEDSPPVQLDLPLVGGSNMPVVTHKG